MEKLEKNQYYKVTELLNSSGEECKFALSVIDNNIPGEVYVNCIDNPESCLIASISGKYLVLGKETNEAFNKDIINFLKKAENHHIFYDLYASSNKWIDILEEMLRGSVVRLKRSIYIYKGENIDDIGLSSDYEMKKMDEVLFYKYADEMDSTFKVHWGTPSNFSSNGIGYCIMKDKEIVSVCTTFYIGGGYSEISIDTIEKFRKKGFATKACQMFINTSLNKKLIPLWDADYGNGPSNQLAAKLGFTKIKDCEILWWHENQKAVAKYLKKYNYENK